MLMHTKKGTTIETQQEKVTKETRRQKNKRQTTKGSALFDPSVVEKASLVICDGQFSFWAKPTFTPYIF